MKTIIYRRLAMAAAFLLLSVLASHPLQLAAQAVAATWMQNADQPGRQPYSEGRTFVFGESSACTTTLCRIPFSAVPAGKRLVITRVTSSITLTGEKQPVVVTLKSQQYFGAPAGGESDFAIRVDFAASSKVHRPFSNLIANQEVKVYADSGPIVPTVQFFTSDSDLGSAMQFISLTGYYIDIP